MKKMTLIEKLFGLRRLPTLSKTESQEFEDTAIFVGLESDPEHYAIVPDVQPEPAGVSLEHVATLHEHRVGELARSVANPVKAPLHKCPTCGELTLREPARYAQAMDDADALAVAITGRPDSSVAKLREAAAQAPGPFQPGYTPPRCCVCNLLGGHKPAADGKHYCKKHRPEVA